MSKAKKKWVSVRPLPSIRNFPQQYDVSPTAGSARCPFPFSPGLCSALRPGPLQSWQGSSHVLDEVGGWHKLRAERSQTRPAKGWSRKRRGTHLNHAITHVCKVLTLLLMQAASQGLAGTGLEMRFKSPLRLGFLNVSEKEYLGEAYPCLSCGWTAVCSETCPRCVLEAKLGTRLESRVLRRKLQIPSLHPQP